MDLNRYSDRAKALLGSAQGIALRMDHQRLEPAHLMKALLDDRDGLAANLIRASGGDPVAITQMAETELATIAKVTGGDQLYMTPDLGKVLATAEDLANKAGDSFITAERMLQALVATSGSFSKKLQQA